MEDELEGIRPNVKKYLPQFTQYVKQHGADAVYRVLDKGHYGTLRLTFPLNKKDRYQMIQMLSIHKEKK